MSATSAMLATALVVVAGGVIVMHRLDGPSAAAATTTTSTTPPTTSVAPTTTITTTPSGDLPQTRALPAATTAGLRGRMTALLRAIATDDPAAGYGSFFPLPAYLQTKAGYGNASDWHYRLIGHFSEDVATYHRELGAGAPQARLVGYSVNDSQAVWVLPGVEGNKGPYWRVYYTTLNYAIGQRRGSISINTMISWRGEWYVVHLIGFNS